MIFRLATATAVGVVLAGAVAAPAFAEDVIGVTLSSVPSSFSVGSRADNFSVQLRNNTNGNVAAVSMQFTIRLNGLTASEVRIRTAGNDLPIRDDGGQVVAADPHTHDFLPRIGRTDIGYTIEFLTGAPSGKATLTATAIKQTSVLGQASGSISVKGSGAAPSASASAFPTESPTTPETGSLVPPSAGGVALSPQGASGQIPSDSGGIPVGLYIMGALLVGVGGVILWMLFRQRPAPMARTEPPTYPTGEFDAAPPTLGYPAGRASAAPRPSATMSPTAPLPALRGSGMPNPRPNDPPNPPPPVDPWASQGGNRSPRHGSD
jgi:hypothetical protein